MINNKSIVRKKEEIITAQLDENAVMMSIDNGKYYGMNEIATVIWDHIKKPVCVEQLVHILTDQFYVSEERCQTEVITFLTKLYNEKLIDTK